jgi:branched-chain amino acid transport system substrate-binding protein
MKKIIALVLALCMVFTLCACGGSGDSADSGEKVVKIGVFEPSSGDSASGGKKEILGMQYANSLNPEVVIGGETYKVELVYGDNGSSTDKAPSAASSLVSAGVSIVLGSYGSGVSMEAAPSLKKQASPRSAFPAPTPT